MAGPTKKSPKVCSLKLDSVRIENFLLVCDAVAWLEHPTPAEIAQFANLDARTVGKASKNGRLLDLFDTFGADRHRLRFSYPPQGTADEKRAAIRSTLIRHPIVGATRDFLKLGDKVGDAFRKGCTKAGVTSYDEAATRPLLMWATDTGALDLGRSVEQMQQQAIEARTERHASEPARRVVFLSHSSRDKDFVRRLAADLTTAGVTVWIDEQDIVPGQSFVERISEGVYSSDAFVFVSSGDSVKSEWARKELNLAFSKQLSSADIVIVPAKIDDTDLPSILKDTNYADFRTSYSQGFERLMAGIRRAK